MHRFGFIIVPCLALTLAAGCDNYRKVYPPEEVPLGGGGGGGGGAKTTELNTDGWATLEGQITWPGDLPSNNKLNVDKDKGVCLCEAALQRGEDHDQVWIGKKMGDVSGVANVVVFLKSPAGTHFKVHDDYKDVSKHAKLAKAVLDQPFCAYEPRVIVLYPGYIDGGKLLSSGQVFEVKNSATVPHNTKIKGNPLFNSDKSVTINPGLNDNFTLVPQDTELKISCDVHPWMTGYAWSFNHPYAARTDVEGKFKIENVPAGAEVSVVIWHEGIGFYGGDGFEAKQGKKMTFAKGAPQTLNVTLKK